MDKKEKAAKKDFIRNYINLGNGRFKDYEVDSLLDLAENREKYNGKSKTYKHSFDDWCSDGKYTRTETTSYTIKSDDDGIHIDEHYEYHDDDGQHGSYEKSYSTGRDLLNILHKVLEK